MFFVWSSSRSVFICRRRHGCIMEFAAPIAIAAARQISLCMREASTSLGGLSRRSGATFSVAQFCSGATRIVASDAESFTTATTTGCSAVGRWLLDGSPTAVSTFTRTSPRIEAAASSTNSIGIAPCAALTISALLPCTLRSTTPPDSASRRSRRTFRSSAFCSAVSGDGFAASCANEAATSAAIGNIIKTFFISAFLSAKSVTDLLCYLLLSSL